MKRFSTMTINDTRKMYFFNISLSLGLADCPNSKPEDVYIIPVVELLDPDEDNDDPGVCKVRISLYPSECNSDLVDSYAHYLAFSDKSPLLTEKAAKDFYKGKLTIESPAVKLDENGKLISFKLRDLPWKKIFNPSIIGKIEEQDPAVEWCFPEEWF